MELLQDIEEIIISDEQLQEKVVELGAQITKDYQGREPVLVCVLKGAMMFLTDLSRHIKLPVSFDFMEVSSYHGTETTGVVRITKDLKGTIEGKDVIIVEDILDSGLTLTYITKLLKTRNPNSLKICSLLDKKDARITPVTLDYKGFDIPDKFVVGYGLDYNELYRNLNFIGALKSSVYKGDE